MSENIFPCCCNKSKKRCFDTRAAISSNSSSLVCGFCLYCVSDADINATVIFCDSCGNTIEKEHNCISASAGRNAKKVTETFCIPCGATMAKICLSIDGDIRSCSRVEPIAYFC